MPAFIEVGFIDRLAPEGGISVAIGSNTVALFRIDGGIYAIEGCCLRCGAQLAEGCLGGQIVGCRGCDWRYDVTTGSVVGVPALRLHTFETRVVDGKVAIAND